MDSKKGHFMVVGKTGGGKTAISADVVRTFLSARQLRDWRELRKGSQKDGKKPGGKHHDNQR